MTRLRTDALGHGFDDAATGETRWVFSDVSVEFPEGKFTAIIGPNGSGKSTLLRDLVGVTPPSAGRVLLGDTAITESSQRQRARQLAYLPQATPLYFDMTVRDLVLLGRAPHLGRFSSPGAEDGRIVEAALGDVAISHLADRGVLTLSGGEKQRVMLARMIATEAPLLVLDEPTSALDVCHALAFLDLCRRYTGQGKTVVMAMHDLDFAKRYADSVLVIPAVGAAQFGPTTEVMDAANLGTVFGVEVVEQDRGILLFPC